MAGRIISRSLGLIKASSPRWAAINTLTMILRSFLPLAGLVLLKKFVDLIIAVPSTTPSIPHSFIWLIVAIAAILLGDDILAISGRYSAKKLEKLLEERLFRMIHSHAIRLGLSSFEDASFHELLERASTDAVWRPAGIISNMILLFRGAISFIFMAVILSRFNILLIVILLVAFIPAFLSRALSSLRLYKVHPQQTALSRKSAYFSWLITGERPARETRLFGLGSYFDSLYRKYFNEEKDLELKAIRKGSLFETTAAVFKAIVFTGVIIYFSLSLTKGQISTGELVMYIVAFRQAMVYLRDAVAGLTGIEEDKLFIRDFFSFMERKEEIIVKEPVMAVPQLTTGIEISNLTFSYPGAREAALKDINITIKEGEKIAIVGDNGSGKSTLVKLLCRLYDPDQGEIKYSGVQITHFDPEEYRKHFSVVFQDFMLYYLNARENIGISDLSIIADDERLKTVARRAGLGTLLEELPHGFDTPLGHLESGGRELSWGEWQKIAIARALFRKSPVLILDEPSSSLDAGSEYQIFSQLDEITVGRTTVFISHRLSNVIKADRIIVLRQGRVAEAGTHEELMEMNGVYSSMYLRQKSMYR